jgi:hypothetical protein
MPTTFLTRAEAAKILRVSEESLRKGKSGTRTVPKIKMGRKYVYSLRQLDEWMRSREKVAAATALELGRGRLKKVS